MGLILVYGHVKSLQTLLIIVWVSN